MNKKQIHRVALELAKIERRERHAVKRKVWVRRLALAVVVGAVLAVIGLHFHQSLTMAGSEWIGGAAAHWLFFGTAE